MFLNLIAHVVSQGESDMWYALYAMLQLKRTFHIDTIRFGSAFSSLRFRMFFACYHLAEGHYFVTFPWDLAVSGLHSYTLNE